MQPKPVSFLESILSKLEVSESGRELLAPNATSAPFRENMFAPLDRPLRSPRSTSECKPKARRCLPLATGRPSPEIIGRYELHLGTLRTSYMGIDVLPGKRVFLNTSSQVTLFLSRALLGGQTAEPAEGVMMPSKHLRVILTYWVLGLCAILM